MRLRVCEAEMTPLPEESVISDEQVMDIVGAVMVAPSVTEPVGAESVMEPPVGAV